MIKRNGKLPPISIILGAGSSAFVHIPSTQALTQRVRSIRFPALAYRGQSYITSTGHPFESSGGLIRGTPVCDALYAVLAGQYLEPNFELILHAVETLESFPTTLADQVNMDFFKPVLSAFVDPMFRWRELFDPVIMADARTAIIKTIWQTITNMAWLTTDEQLRPLQTAIGAIQQNYLVRCFTLNYDDLIDRCTPWFDGFTIENQDTTRGFDRTVFLQNYKYEQLLCHMHGSVRFRYIGSLPWELVQSPLGIRYQDPPDLPPYAERNAAGEVAFAGPIISGLRKTEKLNTVPYAYFTHALVDSLATSPLMIIAGYGGQDVHINFWILEHRRIHGKEQRIAFITSKPDIGTFEESPLTRLLNSICGSANVNTWRANNAINDDTSADGTCLISTAEFPPRSDSDVLTLLTKHLEK
jgi:hypothetical protein